MKQTAVAVWIINTTETTECTAGLALRNSRARQAMASSSFWTSQCLEQNTPFGQAESANFFGKDRMTTTAESFEQLHLLQNLRHSPKTPG
jgi:hypothetical protein